MPDQNTTGTQTGANTPASGTGGQQQTPPNQQTSGDQGNSQQQTNGQGGTPETWDAWLAAQPEEQRTVVTRLYEAQTTGLRSALQSERDGRKALETQIRELQKSVEKGSESERKLTEMVTSLESANRRADFLEAAVKPDVGLADLEAAWIIVQAKPDDYVGKRGVDFALLKERHPGLFKSVPQTPRGNAGSGTTSDAPNGANMNDFIRKAAGR